VNPVIKEELMTMPDAKKMAAVISVPYNVLARMPEM
jgi:hypothetical protein